MGEVRRTAVGERRTAVVVRHVVGVEEERRMAVVVHRTAAAYHIAEVVGRLQIGPGVHRIAVEVVVRHSRAEEEERHTAHIQPEAGLPKSAVEVHRTFPAVRSYYFVVSDR